MSERVKKKVTVALTGDGEMNCLVGTIDIFIQNSFKIYEGNSYRLRSKFFKLLSYINSDKISNFLLKYNDSIKTKVSNFGDKFSKISEKFTILKMKMIYF